MIAPHPTPAPPRTASSNLTLCRLPDPDIEETFALAAHLVGYALDLVERALPDHTAAERLRAAIDALGTTAGFRCADCGQIRPAEDFTLIPTGEGGRQQPCDACCTARAAGRRPGPDAEGSR